MKIEKLRTIGRLIGKYKYLITIVVCTSIVVFLDENSFFRRWEYKVQISDLREEIDSYTTSFQRDSAQLYELKHNPNAIKKVARERYFMKADNEDIFVLSDDRRKNEQNHETTK